MNFQFGNLPYGYNPCSSSMTTPGGVYGDTPVWNLADSQVQSQMTGPLFANMPYLGINNNYNSQVNNTGNFYNNLLMTQAAAGGGYSAASGNDMMTNLFQMMMMMKQLEKAKESKSSSSTSSTSKSKSVDDDDDGYNAKKASHEKEENDAKSSVKKFVFNSKEPLVGLKGFIKNDNDESTFKYGDFDKFKSTTYTALTKKGKVSLESIKEAFGIDLSEIPSNQRKASEAILKSYADKDGNVSIEKYDELLQKLGINGDEPSMSISRKTFKDNIDSLVGVESKKTSETAKSGDFKVSRKYELTSSSTPEEIQKCADNLAYIFIEANQSALKDDFKLDVKVDDPQVKKQLLEKVQAKLKDNKYNVANFNRHWGTDIKEVGMLFDILDKSDGKEDMGMTIDKKALAAFKGAKQKAWLGGGNNVHINYKDNKYSIDYNMFSGIDGYRVYDKTDKMTADYTSKWDDDAVMFKKEN